MSRIRVVFTIGAMHGGGSERQMLTLLRHLDRSRFEPFLYLIYRTGPLLSQVPDDVRITAFEERVAASRLYLPGRDHRRRVRDFAAFLREVDAQLCYDRTFLMTLIAADAAQQAAVPNVSTIVTNPEHGFAPVAGRFQWFKRRLLHRFYNRSARVVAVSEGVREAAIRFYGIDPERIFVIPNGVDGPSLRETASEHPVDDVWWNSGGPDTVRLVTAGRLNHEKGFHLLIEAVDRLRTSQPDRDWKLAILGDGPHHQMLQSQIDRLSLSEQVRLTGFRDNAAAWYQSADVFVLPSLVEGMPNVLLEAMAVHTPVVAADCESGPAEILRQGELGELVDVNSVSALCDGVLRVVSSPDAARSKAAAATALVETDRSATTNARQLEALFAECARPSHAQTDSETRG